jgi:hypothetical protein
MAQKGGETSMGYCSQSFRAKLQILFLSQELKSHEPWVLISAPSLTGGSVYSVP